MTKEIKIDSVPDLVKRVNAEWQRKSEEAGAERRRLEEKLKVAVQEERAITKKLEEARKVVSQMESEYSEIEGKLEAETKRRIGEETIKEADVRSGKVKLGDFFKAGKTDKQIADETVQKVTAELEQALKAIRAKRLEIMRDEKVLTEVQLKIRQLILSPGLILQETLRKVMEFADEEMGLFLIEVHSARSALQQIDHRLLLTQGKSLTPGYKWDRMTLAEARKIAFDPILDERLIPSLLQQLEAYKDKESVLVSYYLGKGDSPGYVDVSSHGTIRVPKTKWKAL